MPRKRRRASSHVRLEMCHLHILKVLAQRVGPESEVDQTPLELFFTRSLPNTAVGATVAITLAISGNRYHLSQAVRPDVPIRGACRDCQSVRALSASRHQFYRPTSKAIVMILEELDHWTRRLIVPLLFNKLFTSLLLFLLAALLGTLFCPTRLATGLAERCKCFSCHLVPDAYLYPLCSA